MRTLKYTFWQDGEFFLGYLNDYPDYVTQGYSKDELLENKQSQPVPRHSEINEILARSIIKKLTEGSSK